MVTIINFKERIKEDGTTFFVLELQGGIELVQSQTTKQFYATAKKAYIPSTFDLKTCKALIGTQMPGSIQKVECEPYEYTIQDTGEEITLEHRWTYAPEGTEVIESEGLNFVTGAPLHSQNGMMQEAYA